MTGLVVVRSFKAPVEEKADETDLSVELSLLEEDKSGGGAVPKLLISGGGALLKPPPGELNVLVPKVPSGDNVLPSGFTFIGWPKGLDKGAERGDDKGC